MSSAKDEDGKEVEIDWNDPFQRVKFFFEYSSPDAEKVHLLQKPLVAIAQGSHISSIRSASTPSGATT